MKRHWRWMRGLALWAAVCGWAIPFSAAARGGESVLFVAPARYSVIQVMLDVSRRNGAALVSYQGEPDSPAPLLHLWNGSEWVYVPFESFRSGHFLSSPAHRVVLIGDRSVLPESLAAAASEWAPVVMNVESMDASSLVNAAGQVLHFGKSDWAWFADRYNMAMTDEAAAQRKKSWYDGAYEEPAPPESPWRMFRRWLRSKPAPAAKDGTAPAPVVAPAEAPVPVPPVPAEPAEPAEPATVQPVVPLPPPPAMEEPQPARPADSDAGIK